MSVEDVQKFRSAVSAQPDFQQKLQAQIAAEPGTDMKERTAAALVALGAAQGFSFTTAELKDAAASVELSDTELEHIAGGGS
ncbi:MAG: Nif11-like leader peptide family RiPP precursor [Vicinamibacterales bacterium]